MNVQIEQTFTLTEVDIKQAVAEFLTSRMGWQVPATSVKIDIDPGAPFYNQLDAGRAPSVKITATINKPAPAAKPPQNPVTTGSAC